MKKEYRVVARETITHSYIVEAKNQTEAEELALEGCPLPDADCTALAFDIVSIKPEPMTRGRAVHKAVKL